MSKNAAFTIALILCLVGIAWCILDIKNPEILWNIFEKWKSNGATQSSYDYDTRVRVGGVIGLVIIGYLLISLLCTWIWGVDFPLGAGLLW